MNEGTEFVSWSMLDGADGNSLAITVWSNY